MNAAISGRATPGVWPITKHVPEQDPGQHPGEVAGDGEDRADDQRHVPQLRTHVLGVVVLPEGKPGDDAQVFEHVGDEYTIAKYTAMSRAP